MNKNLILKALASTAIGLLFAAGVAAAQDAATSNNESATVLEAIVVKGDKVGRTGKEATPSTTIISGEKADQPENTDIKNVINKEANVLSERGIQMPSVRGVDGSGGQRQAFTAGTQARVPILIDDVARPLSNSGAISRSSLWDVDSVEVARGSQATSTGRNAFGGAIRIYTADPEFEKSFAARVGATSTDGSIGAAVMANVPLIDDELAIRLTGEATNGKDYINVLTPVPSLDVEDQRYRRWRGKLLWEPSELDGLSVLFSVDRIETQAAIEGFFNGDPDDLQVSGPFGLTNSYEDNEQTTYTLKTTYDINDNVSVVGRLSYLDNNLLFPDAGAGLGNVSFDQDQYEGEAYVQFTDIGYLRRGVIGVISNRETEKGLASGGLFSFSTDGEIRNTGIYAEGEFSLDSMTEGLTAIVGGRYEYDNRNRQVNSPATVVISDATMKEGAFMPKLGLRYNFTDDDAIGYTYTRGFRNGGTDVDLVASFFGSPIVAFAEFGPETIDQHEVWAKTSLLDDTLRLGGSLFYYQWHDAQVPGAATTVGATGGNLFGNIPEAVGYGAELTAEYDITPNWTVNGAIGLLKTEITDAGSILAAFNGKDLPRSPSLTASAGLAYRSDNGFDAAANVRFTGSTTSALSEPEMASYAVVDLKAGYEFDTATVGKLRLDAFIENVFDKRYLTFRESNVGSNDLMAVGRPRTYGVSLTAKF